MDRTPEGSYEGNASELQGAAYVEGWGLYSGRLADEMGLYADDHERLGMLNLQALRAARLVADTGIHALGWTRKQSIATLRASGCDQRDAADETDRYAAIPGRQADLQDRTALDRGAPQGVDQWRRRHPQLPRHPPWAWIAATGSLRTELEAEVARPNTQHLAGALGEHPAASCSIP